MNCPHCTAPLASWPWEDGGYRGLACHTETGGCGARWWSEAFARAAGEAEEQAVAHLLRACAFPADVITEEEYEAMWQARADVDMGRPPESPEPAYLLGYCEEMLLVEELLAEQRAQGRDPAAIFPDWSLRPNP